MSGSLQTRLLLSLALGASTVLLGAGGLLYSLIRVELIAEFDSAISADARLIASRLEYQNGSIELEHGDFSASSFGLSSEPVLYQFFDSQGHLLSQSETLGSEDPHWWKIWHARPVAQFVRSRDQSRARLAGFELTSSEADEHEVSFQQSQPSIAPEKPLTLLVARSTRGLDRTLYRLGWLLVGVCGGATALSLAVSAPFVRSGLRPLLATSAAIADIDSKSLGQRLDSAKAPLEIRVVFDRLNDLLDRLAETFRRERAFSANVAHELRTPLAGLRSIIDVALARPRSTDEYAVALAECLTICLQVEAISENLLLLARLDADEWPVAKREVDLSELLRTTWDQRSHTAAARGVNLRWQLESNILILSDPDLLKLIFRNLLENAATYSDAPYEIVAAAGIDESGTRISVQNPCADLPADTVERVFHRFWRHDESRSATGLNAGLGLALCQEAARALGGSLLATSENGQFRIELRLPTCRLGSD